MTFPDELSNIPHIYGYNRSGIDITTIYPSGEHHDITINKTGSLLLVPEVEDPEFLAFNNPFQTPSGKFTVLTDEVSIDLANPGVGEVYINRSNGDFKFNALEPATDVYFFYTGYGSVVKADTYYNPVSSGLVETQEYVLTLASGINEHTSNFDNPHQITANQIGAAEVDHNHDNRYYTEDEIASLLANKENILPSGAVNTYLNGNKEFVSITPSDIGAAENDHTHIFNDLTVTGNLTDEINTITIKQISDLFNIETRSNQIVEGGQVSWVSGLTFDVGAAVYYINRVRYTSESQQITLDAADALYDRVDVIALDINGDVVKITGTPSEQPQKPFVDPENYVECTFVLVPAGGLVSSVEQINIYLDNAEWTINTSGSNIIADSTTSPYSGNYCIEMTNCATGDFITFTSSEPLDILNTAHVLVFYIKLKTQLNDKLSVQFFNDSSEIGNRILIYNGLFGLDVSNVNTYQKIVIPIYFFNIPNFSYVNKLKIGCVGTSIGCYIDSIVLQSGMPTVTPQKTWSVIATDNGYFKARFTDDTLSIKGGQNVNTSINNDGAVVISASGFAEINHNHNTDYYTKDEIDSFIPGSSFYEHLEDFNNPHQVTYEQVGAAPSGHNHDDLYQPIGSYINSDTLLSVSGSLQDQIDNKSDNMHEHIHGNLSELLQDDHVQYILANGTRPFSGTVSGVNPTADAHLSTKWYVDSISGVIGSNLSAHIQNTNNPHVVTYQQVGAAASGHLHDDRYYTQNQVDTILTGYQPSGNYTDNSIFLSASGYLQEQIDLKPNVDDFINQCPLQIYLSPSGNDTTGNGSIAAPWATLDKALKYLKNQNAGGAIYLAPGTYIYDASQYENYPTDTYPVCIIGVDLNVSNIEITNISYKDISEVITYYIHFYVSCLYNVQLLIQQPPDNLDSYSMLEYCINNINGQNLVITNCHINMAFTTMPPTIHYNLCIANNIEDSYYAVLNNTYVTYTSYTPSYVIILCGMYGGVYNCFFNTPTYISGTQYNIYNSYFDGCNNNLIIDNVSAFYNNIVCSNLTISNIDRFNDNIIKNNLEVFNTNIFYNNILDGRSAIYGCNYLYNNILNMCKSISNVKQIYNNTIIINSECFCGIRIPSTADNINIFNNIFKYSGSFSESNTVAFIQLFNCSGEHNICNNYFESPTISLMIGHGFQPTLDPNFQTLDRKVRITGNTFVNKFAAEFGPDDQHANVHIHSRGEFLIADNVFIQDSTQALNTTFNNGMALRLVRPNAGTAKATILNNYFETNHPPSGQWRSSIFCSVASGVGGEWDLTLSNNIFNPLSEQAYTIVGDASPKFLGQNISSSPITCQTAPIWNGVSTSSIVVPNSGNITFNDSNKWQIGLNNNNLNFNYSGDTIASFKPTDVNINGKLCVNTSSPKSYATCHIRQESPIVVLESYREDNFYGYLAQYDFETILATEYMLRFKSGVPSEYGPLVSGINLGTWTASMLDIVTPVQISGVQECLQITATALETNKTAMKLSPTIASANVNAAAGLDITLSNAQNDTGNCSSRAAYFKYLHTGTFTGSSRLCQVNAMRADASHGGATSGTNANKSVYGVIGTASNTGAVTSGTSVRYTYGGYFRATGSSDGTSYAYGVYATATGANVNAAFLGDGTQAFMSVNDGAAATPSFTFFNERNTGMYRATSNALAFAVNGTERFRITPSGVKATGYIASDNSVGIDYGIHCLVGPDMYNFLYFKNGLLVDQYEY